MTQYVVCAVVLLLSSGCSQRPTVAAPTAAFDAARPPVDATVSVAVGSITAALPLLSTLAPLATVAGIDVDVKLFSSAQADAIGLSRHTPVWLHLRPTMAVFAVAVDPTRFALAMMATAEIKPLLANTWTTASSPARAVWTLHGDQAIAAIAFGDSPDVWAAAAYLKAFTNDVDHRMVRAAPAPLPVSPDTLLATWWQLPTWLADVGATDLRLACRGDRIDCTTTVTTTPARAVLLDQALAMPAPAAWCAVAPHHSATIIIPPIDDLASVLSSLSGIEGSRWQGPVVVGIRPSLSSDLIEDDWLSWIGATIVATPAGPAAVAGMRADVLSAAPTAAKRVVGGMQVQSVASSRSWRQVHMAMDDRTFAASFGDALPIDAIAAHAPCPPSAGRWLDVDSVALSALLGRGGSPLAPWLAKQGIEPQSAAIKALGHLTATAKVDGDAVVVAWSGG